MSYMCFYGVGKDTERAYEYTGTPGKVQFCLRA